MPGHPDKLHRFWQELKRRRVIHVITVYASASFVLIELVNNLTEPLNLPTNLAIILIIVLTIGFPLAIILSWLYDLTGEGIEKTKPIDEVPEGQVTKVPNAWKIATVISFVVIIGLVVLNLAARDKLLKPGSIQSLVILPFDNFTGDDQLEYFVSGMHSSLIGDMGKISGLRVISKTSSITYKDMDMSVPQIAAELDVDAAVEASVMCLGEDSICIQFKLISAFPEEKQLWIADYKEEKSQILNLYNRVTKHIAEEVQVELTPNEERLLAEVLTVDKEAYDAFLRGRYYWDDLSPESLYKALEYLNLAIEKDPGFAPPYAGIAQVWVGLAQMGFAPPEIAGPKIYKNINKALELDPNFADSHFINGIIAVWTEWNWEKGEKEFLHALAINPNDAMSRIYYAHLLMSLQRTDEAQSQGLRAAELDPLNPLLLGLYGVVLTDADRWEEAYEACEKGLTLDPDNFFTTSVLEFVAYHLERYEASYNAAKHYLSNYLDKEALDQIDKVYREQNYQMVIKEIVYQMELKAQSSHLPPLDIGARYLFIGNKEKALECFEKGFEMHDPNMPYLAVGFVQTESLFDEPRFLAILEKMNLPLPRVQSSDD